MERQDFLAALASLFRDTEFAHGFRDGAEGYDEDPDQVKNIKDDAHIKYYLEENLSYRLYQREKRIAQATGTPFYSYRYQVGFTIGMLLNANMDHDPHHYDTAFDPSPLLSVLLTTLPTTEALPVLQK